MIWQNLVPNAHDSITQLSPHDIDPTVALTQSSTPTIEPVLWTTLHADTAGGMVDHDDRAHWTQRHARRTASARWASMTTALSPTGTRPHAATTTSSSRSTRRRDTIGPADRDADRASTSAR